jgi:hypothetical protein
VTGDTLYRELLAASARGVMMSGIPARQTSGYWHNLGQCCGHAGVADFMMNLYRITRRTEYLGFARTMMDDALRKANREPSGGLSWTHAEHRVRPEDLTTQTGFMQGAAGIGMACCRLDAILNDRRYSYVPPDSPFPP